MHRVHTKLQPEPSQASSSRSAQNFSRLQNLCTPRFHSPLSYWNDHHHARWVGILELALVLASMGILWQRFESRIVRGALLLGLASLAAVPAFFWWTLG